MSLLNPAHLFRDVRFSLPWFLNYGRIVLGSLLMAVGYVYFLIPYKVVTGGVFGISIVLHHMFGLPTGATALVLNIPLLVWGVRELGPKFGVKTLLGLFLTSGFTDLLTYTADLVSPLWQGGPSPAQEPFMACLFGGAFVGTGLGFIFKAKATTGGSDILAQVINKRFHTPIGQVLIIADSMVIGLGVVLLQQMSLALYGVVTIFVVGRVVDTVLTGTDFYKTLLIVSEKHEQIREQILQVLGRGGTYLDGSGLYSSTAKKVILCAVSRRELPIVEEFLQKVDPNAFIIVLDSREILGKGFKPISENP